MALGLRYSPSALADSSLQQGGVSAALGAARTLCGKVARFIRRQSQHKVRPRLLVATVAHMDDADRRLREATVDRRTH